MSSFNDPVWVEEHAGYWDDDLPRSFPEEEEEDESNSVRHRD
jgi:hypothetical protein